MNQQTEKRLLLADALPAFAAELRQLLEEQGEPELAAQVAGLTMVDRCRCGDDFCATFYTQLRKLARIAVREDVPVSWLIRKAIDEFLKRKK